MHLWVDGKQNRQDEATAPWWWVASGAWQDKGPRESVKTKPPPRHRMDAI